MNVHLKIESIKRSLPKLGLADRFFYLTNELYQDYFKDYNENYDSEEREQINYEYEWCEYDKTWALSKTEDLKAFQEYESLYLKFLQSFGNRELRDFILLELKHIVSIFWQKYSFQLSFLYNPNYTRNYYLSGDSEFLLLSPFFYDEQNFKAAIIHELSISDIDERQFLLNKYQSVLSEIKYRINSSIVWDASLEVGRTEIADEIVYPERRIFDLENLSSFLLELQESSLEELPDYFSSDDRRAKEEGLGLIGVDPNHLVKLFLKILHRDVDEIDLVRNFVAEAFKYEFRKYIFDHEITKDVLELKNRDDTIKICQVISLMMKKGCITNMGTSLTKRVLMRSFRKDDNKNKRAGMSDNLKKDIPLCMIMDREDLLKAIGFSSELEFEKFIYIK